MFENGTVVRYAPRGDIPPFPFLAEGTIGMIVKAKEIEEGWIQYGVRFPGLKKLWVDEQDLEEVPQPPRPRLTALKVDSWVRYFPGSDQEAPQEWCPPGLLPRPAVNVGAFGKVRTIEGPSSYGVEFRGRGFFTLQREDLVPARPDPEGNI